MSATPESRPQDSQAYLPDFCAASTLFIVLLVAELVAIALTLAAHDTGGQFLIELSKTSFFVLWLALLGAAVMCQLRNRLESSGATRAFVISFIVLEVICLLLAEISWQLTRVFAESSIIHDTHGNFILRTFAISSIVIALATPPSRFGIPGFTYMLLPIVMPIFGVTTGRIRDKRFGRLAA